MMIGRIGGAGGGTSFRSSLADVDGTCSVDGLGSETVGVGGDGAKTGGAVEVEGAAEVEASVDTDGPEEDSLLFSFV